MRRSSSALALLRPSEFGCAFARCPFCGPSAIVRLKHDEIAVRCIRCGASAVHLALGAALRALVPELRKLDVCELSARGPLAGYLLRHARSAALSEFFAGVASGETLAGVRCEDVQALSYADQSFDVITHTEVTEHVPDDARAFAELRRVLRPGGIMLFTVPLQDGPVTVERARACDGAVEHLLPPAYHGDPLRGSGKILVHRDYGRDIIERLRRAGFVQARLHVPSLDLKLAPLRSMVVAQAPAH